MYGHQDLDLWVRQFAVEWAEKDQLYVENDRFHRLDPVDHFYESKRIQRSVELFPAIYDLQFLKSGSSLKGGTFRILVSDIEQQFMERVSSAFFFFEIVRFSVEEKLFIHRFPRTTVAKI